MYNYKTERKNVFTEDGQEMFMSIYTRTMDLLKSSGAARLGNMISGTSGSTWIMLACVDRMVELKYIREIPTDGSAQDRVFVATRQSA